MDFVYLVLLFVAVTGFLAMLLPGNPENLPKWGYVLLPSMFLGSMVLLPLVVIMDLLFLR